MKVCFCGSSYYSHPKVYITHWGPVYIARCKKCCLTRDISEYPYDFYYSDEACIYTLLSEAQYQNKIKDIQPYLNFINSYINYKGAVLEVGCNAGFFLDALQKQGWSTTGVEINPTLARFALSRGLNVINKKLDEISFSANAFDLIVTSHTLEHIPNLKEHLSLISRILKHGGYLFIVVPDYGSFALRMVYGGRLNCFIPGQHIWYFTKTSLKNICETLNFKLIDCRTRIYITPRSRVPLGGLVKQILIWWLKCRKEGEELIGLFQKI